MKILLTTVLLCLNLVTLANENYIPGALKDWVPWVNHGETSLDCPYQYNSSKDRICSFPGRLELTANETGGTFTQHWQTFEEGRYALPGNHEHWPLEVTNNGKKVVIVPKDDRPSIFLTKGKHLIKGKFSWKRLPEFVQIPSHTGIVQLQVKGKKIKFPKMDPQGKLWFQKQMDASEQKSENHLDVKIHRLVTDSIPLKLTTVIEVNVSGQPRAVDLGAALPQNFVPMELSSSLPTTLLPGGQLRVQVRAGAWNIKLIARHDGKTDSIQAPTPTGVWAEEEVWAFEAKNTLRMVTVEGVNAVDPLQTSLPKEWNQFPAFLVKPGDVFTLKERTRGNTKNAAGGIGLQRTLWLDFNGEGLSIRDRIQGKLNEGWRLEMDPKFELGKVSVDGKNQLITRGKKTGWTGVEIRDESLRIEAQSRLPSFGVSIPSSGWSHDFQTLEASLHLPPGWRAIATSGVDYAYGTWMNYWNLGNIFLWVLLFLAVAKLKSKPWAAITGLILALIFPEDGAPRYLWLGALACIIVVPLLPEGKIKSAAKFLKLITLGVLAVVSLLFAHQQVRTGLFPVLEKEYKNIQAESYESDWNTYGSKTTRGAVGGSAEMSEEDVATSAFGNRVRSAKDSYRNKSFNQQITRIDPNAVVQLGPGLPNWNWNSVTLRWSGPVSQGETLRLFLTPPWLNSILNFIRAISVLLLLILLAKISLPKLSFPQDKLSWFIFIPLFCFGAPGWSNDLPTPELLTELKTRIQEPPSCFPHCAALQRMSLNYEASTLTIRMSIDSAIPAAVPLPGGVSHWMPQEFLLNGSPVHGIYRDSHGNLWMLIPKGNQTVLLRGSLPERDVVQLPIALRPHNVSASGKGWTVEGLHDDGQADSTLELRRNKLGKRSESKSWEAKNLPPFVLVEREIALGLSWKVRTRLSRLTPMGSAVVLGIPLLPGESVTSSNVRVDQGKAMINMGPSQGEFTWDSVLEREPPLVLKAPEATQWTEEWRLDAAEIWTVELSGIPVIQQFNEEGKKVPIWKPWPGETVTIDVSRSEPIQGQTLSITESNVTLTPGRKTTAAELKLSLQSSRGGEHTIELPTDVEIREVKIKGVTQPIRSDGSKLTLPITPGTQEVEVKWTEPRGMGTLFRGSKIQSGVNSVNSSTKIVTPADRWILLVGGPSVGPAVLIWGELIIILLAAWLLGKWKESPLRSREWLLLGIGLSQSSLLPILCIVGLFFLLTARKRYGHQLKNAVFNLFQMLLVGWGFAAGICLIIVLERGFFGSPRMHVLGNQSNIRHLQWFQDRVLEVLPQPWTVSVPLICYRIAMLVWAIWLALAMLRWIKWGWECFTEGDLWRKRSKLLSTKK